MYMCVYVCMYIHKYIYVYMCMYVCMYVCVCVCCVCVCVCVCCMYTHINIHIHTYIYISGTQRNASGNPRGQKKNSKVLYIVSWYSKSTRTLTFVIFFFVDQPAPWLMPQAAREALDAATSGLMCVKLKLIIMFETKLNEAFNAATCGLCLVSLF